MQWIDHCIGSLRSSTMATDVYVVDNGSNDGTQQYIREHFPEAVFVQNEENVGFGRANNQGLCYAVEQGYDYVYLLNEDAWLFPDTLEKMVSVSQHHPEYGVLSPAQMQADGVEYDRNFSFGPCRQNEQLKRDLSTEIWEDVYEVETIMASHWLLPISTIRKVGVFSPTFQHYAEDDNFTDRVRHWGMKAGVVMGAKAVHDRQYRVEPTKKKVYLHYVSMLRLFSNPSVGFRRAWYRCIGDTLKACGRLKTLAPLWNVIRVLGKWNTIRRSRTISMKEQGAFLLNDFKRNFPI